MARILILTPQLPIPPQALTGTSQGTTIRNFNLIAGLAPRHTVDLVSFVAAEIPASELPEELVRCCRRIITVPQSTRTTQQRIRDTFLSPLPDMALRLASPVMREQLDRLLNEPGAGEYDIIQIEGIEMAGYMPARAGRIAPRLVFDDHNAEYVLQRRACLTDLRSPRRWPAAIYSLIQWRKLVGYERRVCRAADRVVAVSEADAAALRRLVRGLDVAVVPNGVDLDFLQPGVVAPLPGMSPHALVFTGKMDYRPNVDAVLWFVDEVLPLILQQAPDVHFYVVGQQPHARLARLDGHPAVTLTGRVPDVRPYIAGATAYVVPLRIGGGTRLKVLEAMAMGRPIVSTRLGCDGFAFTDGQEVSFADDPATFAASVLALLRDPCAAAELGRRGRQHVEAELGWDAIVPRLEALYR
jgi:polysaccharide biosynthesis protein PslH